MKTLIMTEMDLNEWRSYKNRLSKKSPVTVIGDNNKIDMCVLPHLALFTHSLLINTIRLSTRKVWLIKDKNYI